MTLQAIRNGIATLLSASGPYSASNISACSYDCLEYNVTGCALTFFPEGTSEFEPLAFGNTTIANTDRRKWRIGGTVWINADGAPETCLSRAWQAPHDLYATLCKDNTLGGTAHDSYLVSVTQQPDTFKSAGGHLWKPIDFVVVAEELGPNDEIGAWELEDGSYYWQFEDDTLIQAG